MPGVPVDYMVPYLSSVAPVADHTVDDILQFRIRGKKVVEKWKTYFDKELLNTEIKKKQIILMNHMGL